MTEYPLRTVVLMYLLAQRRQRDEMKIAATAHRAAMLGDKDWKAFVKENHG